MEKPVFSSVEQAVTTLSTITARLAYLSAWMLLGMAHLLVLFALLLVLWAVQVSPGVLWANALAAATSSTGAIAGALGLSLATLAGLYVWLMTKAARAIAGGALFAWLIAPLR